MRVAFLYNAQDHQILHSLPIACRLSELEQDYEVTVLAGNDRQLDLCRELATAYPDHRLRFAKLRSPKMLAWLKQSISTPKVLMLWVNRSLLGSFDALVVPERTTLLLKKMGVKRPKFIHTSHGGGAHDKADDPRLREFDLLLVPNADRLGRIAAAGNARPGHASVIGYVKFDLVRRLAEQRQALFASGRPTILYNPHHRADTSSWRLMGEDVLEYFANQDRYNLIFAPHVRLFDPPSRYLSAFTRYREHENIVIDLGSMRSIDMTYTLSADIYLGDISSQVLEFLIRPRPCIFLNAGKHEWRDNPDFPYWRLGPVVENIAEMVTAIETRDTWREDYLTAQQDAFDAAFPAVAPPPPERAASAIAAYLRHGRVPEDLAAS